MIHQSGREKMNLRIAMLLLKGVYFMLALVILSACGQNQMQTGSNQTAPVGIALDLPKAAQISARAARTNAFVTQAGTVTKINITVKDADGVVLISTSIDVTSDTGEVDVDLDVPAGLARFFFVEALDANGKVLFRGQSDSTDLTIGVPKNITIRMLQAFLDIQPSTANVRKDQTQLFTESGATAVDWLVNGVVGGDVLSGTIAPDGTYAPPARIPIDDLSPILISNDSLTPQIVIPFGVPVDVTVEAVSSADPSVNGTATVHPLTGMQLTFAPNTRVSLASGTIYTDSAGQRGIAYYKGRVYGVWYAFDANQSSDIYFAESGDGTNWTAAQQIAVTFNQTQPAIAVGPDGSLYIAYLGQIQVCPNLRSCSVVPAIQVLVRRPGDTAFSSLTANSLMSGGTLGRPSIAVSPAGVVFVTWSALLAASNNSDVYLSRINGDGTLIDSTPKNLTASDSVDEQNPVAAVGPEGDVFLGYELNLNAPSFIIVSYLTVSLDGGNSFLPGVQVNPATPKDLALDFVTRLTLIPVSGGVVHIAWEEDTCGDGCTFIAYSHAKVSQNAAGVLSLTVDPGVYLGDAVNATRQTAPSIASDGFGGVYIAFHENVLNVGDEIFLAKTTDDGKTFVFSAVSQIGSNRVASTKDNPSLAVDSAGRSFVSWADNRFAIGTPNTDVLFSNGE
jgi:hypothetical protein